jgi:ketosteroid isomerase-like protein
MMKKTVALFFLLISASTGLAQNSNSSTTERPRNVNQSSPSPAKPTPTTTSGSKAQAPAQTPQKTTSPPVTGTDGVVAAVNRLVDGIRTADVEKVMSVYWKSPALILYNYNGTVTKGWDQVRQNRLTSYPEIKDVKLEVRDLAVAMLGRDGAVVNCLWTQSQTYKGVSETASGRMTLVFKRFGNAWKAIHLHTSPDTPNPSAIPPSEQQPSPKPSPTP